VASSAWLVSRNRCARSAKNSTSPATTSLRGHLNQDPRWRADTGRGSQGGVPALHRPAGSPFRRILCPVNRRLGYSIAPLPEALAGLNDLSATTMRRARARNQGLYLFNAKNLTRRPCSTSARCTYTSSCLDIILHFGDAKREPQATSLARTQLRQYLQRGLGGVCRHVRRRR